MSVAAYQNINRLVDNALARLDATKVDQPDELLQADLKALDYGLWKRVGYDGAPPRSGEYELRLVNGQTARAFYDADCCVFGVGDHEARLSEVEWRDIFPASLVERAARLYLAHASAPRRESVHLAEALRAADTLIRDIRHRDARWHDDHMVLQVLGENKRLLQGNDIEGGQS